MKWQVQLVFIYRSKLFFSFDGGHEGFWENERRIQGISVFHNIAA